VVLVFLVVLVIGLGLVPAPVMALVQ
jgi:hypothetical protein